MQNPGSLMSLNGVDMAIVALYFVVVLAIGFYLKRFTKTGNDFFMAGREMTSWVAGLSFVAANLGALELMGWAASSYQYGILAAHWYWIGAIPAMLFLAIVMMPFYYISKTHSVPGYLQLRYGNSSRSLSALCFGVMTVLMSGINMYSMALVLKVVLGWDIHFSIWVSSITVALYVALGGLLHGILVEMAVGGVHHHVGDQHVVHLGDGAGQVVVENLSIGELLVIKTGHYRLLPLLMTRPANGR